MQWEVLKGRGAQTMHGILQDLLWGLRRMCSFWDFRKQAGMPLLRKETQLQGRPQMPLNSYLYCICSNPLPWNLVFDLPSFIFIRSMSNKFNYVTFIDVSISYVRSNHDSLWLDVQTSYVLFMLLCSILSLYVSHMFVLP